MQTVDTSEQAFKAWLMKNAFNYVGTRGESQGCAYARFLRSLGYADAIVTHSVTNTMQMPSGLPVYNETKNPQWLKDFLARFDGLPGQTGVTGAEALKLLEPV